MPPPPVRGGHEGHARAVRREARVEVHGAVGDESPRGPIAGVEHPDLQGVIAVGGVEDVPAVGRPVRLRVVAGAVGQLDGLARAEALAPERALHGVHELLAVRGPRRSARAARDLREVHLPVVVRMGFVDLLEDREALRRRERCGQAAAQERYGRERALENRGESHAADSRSFPGASPQRRLAPRFDPGCPLQPVTRPALYSSASP